MRFSFSDDQRLLAAGVREFLAEECTPQDIRAAWDSPDSGHHRWGQLASLGVLGATAPQDAGGMGLDDVDLVLVMEETGYAGLPEPVVEHAGVAIPLLRDGPAPLRERWLEPAAAGQALVTVCFEPDRYAVAVDRAAVVLYGVAGGLSASEPHELDAEPQHCIDGTRRLFRVSSRGDPHWQGSETDQLLATAADRGALHTSAQLLGVGRRLIDLAAAHARQREQFGRPIGSFQAVKHHLATALVDLEFSRPLVYRAAHSVAHADPEAPVHVSMGKVFAADAARKAARVALQVHGAIGYTWEHDLHLWLKRAWALASAWGDEAHHRARVRDALLGPV